MRTPEEIAERVYRGLPARRKLHVQGFRAFGYPWFDSVVNSGVLSSSGRLVQPEEAARATEREKLAEQFAEITTENNMRMALPTEETRHREASEHEAAHVIVAESFGLKVKLAHVLPGGAGDCIYEIDTPFQTAAIALAGEMWVGTFRSLQFPRGPVGCAADRRTAHDALADNVQLRKAYRYTYQVLDNNQQAVLGVAARLDRDGAYFP